MVVDIPSTIGKEIGCDCRDLVCNSHGKVIDNIVLKYMHFLRRLSGINAIYHYSVHLLYL